MSLRRRIFLVVSLLLCCFTERVISFSTNTRVKRLAHAPPQAPVPHGKSHQNEQHGTLVETLKKSSMVVVAAAVILVGSLSSFSTNVWADELGRETEAPTFSTGENVMICTKRGPLGACLKTEFRTAENDNDVSEKYFRQPTALVKSKDDAARTAEVTEGNTLIERLQRQSEENREKNELLVKQRTMINDSSANFGPFDNQVLILNEDGRGFTLLANPQAMRLKKAGFISDDRKFIKQPTQEQLVNALEPEAGSGFLDRLLGGS
jgi:hypothetical protein